MSKKTSIINNRFFAGTTITLLLLLCLSFSVGGCNSQRNRKSKTIQIDKDIDTLALKYSGVTLGSDTIPIEIFDLKNNYQLILFPSKIDDLPTEKNGGTYPTIIEHSARLIGDKIDMIIDEATTDQAKYLLHYSDIDFDDYFVIEYSGGGNYELHTQLFEKATGRLVMVGYAGTYDTTNDLILLSDEDNNGAVMLYDLRNNKKIEITETFGNPGSRIKEYIEFYKIDKVTPSTIYVGYYEDSHKDGYTIEIDRNSMIDANLEQH